MPSTSSCYESLVPTGVYCFLVVSTRNFLPELLVPAGSCRSHTALRLAGKVIIISDKF